MTQACALACLHCRADALPRRDPLELSTSEGRALIDDLAEAKVPLLVLTGGDPAERPDLEALVEYGVSRGLRVALSPSATPKMTRDRLARLKRARIHRIALSLDHDEEGLHDSFRGVSGSYRRTLEIAREARAMGVRVQIGTTITTLNADRLEAIAAVAAGLGAVLWSVFLLVPTGRAGARMMISAAACEDVLERLCLIARRGPFAVKTTEAPHYRRVAAIRNGRVPGVGINDGKGFAFVSHRGDVCPSGFLPLSAGNIREIPLTELYRDSELFNSLRDPVRLKGRCGACDWKNVCGGSRARAYAVSGDPLGEDPLCDYVPAPGLAVPLLQTGV